MTFREIAASTFAGTAGSVACSPLLSDPVIRHAISGLIGALSAFLVALAAHYRSRAADRTDDAPDHRRRRRRITDEPGFARARVLALLAGIALAGCAAAAVFRPIAPKFYHSPQWGECIAAGFTIADTIAATGHACIRRLDDAGTVDATTDTPAP